MKEDKQKPRSRGFNIGWLIFLLLAFGGPVLRWLQGVWASLPASGAPGSSLPLGSDVIPWIVGGVVATGVVVAVLRAVVGGGGNISPGSPAPPYSPIPQVNRPNIPRSPSFPPAPSSPPPSSASPPYLSGTPQLGGPPRFEPIIDPKVLAFGIVGLLVLAGAWLLFF